MSVRSLSRASTNLRTATVVSTRTFSSTSIRAAINDNQTITLRDGRTLGYGEYGAPHGTPIFVFHGFPVCRLEYTEWDGLAEKLNARLIALDRPGVGLSTFQPDRKILDWPADVSQLAEHLKLDQYRVLGGSGGGPYAVACAYALPKERMRAVGIMGGAGPIEAGMEGTRPIARIATLLVKHFPSAFRWMADRWFVRPAQDPDPQVLKHALRHLKHVMTADEGESYLKKKDVVETFARVFRETFRQGVDGCMKEAELLGQPWGFKLEDIDHDGVRLWYGTNDENTPVSWGRFMADRIKGSVLTEYDGDSHYSLGNHSEDMLKELMSVDCAHR